MAYFVPYLFSTHCWDTIKNLMYALSHILLNIFAFLLYSLVTSQLNLSHGDNQQICVDIYLFGSSIFWWGIDALILIFFYEFPKWLFGFNRNSTGGFVINESILRTEICRLFR